MHNFTNARAESFDACSLHSRYNERLLAEWHGGRVLLRAAIRRLRNRLFGPASPFVPAVSFHGLLVFDRPDLNGGGLWHAEDFSRAMVQFGIGKCDRLFDFCAGPGYIGFYLFASGYCNRLTLADINPEDTEVCRQTARYNKIEDRVSIYTSDVLEEIPSSEKWDLVVANAPVVPANDFNSTNIIDFDISGTLHRRFYSSVKRFMRPGGLILSLHTREHCGPQFFRPMIEAGGGHVVDYILQKDFRGVESDRFYLLSRW